MIQQLFLGKSGMFTFQREMQLITDNVANAQTVGFKRKRAEIESIFPLIQENSVTEFEEGVSGGTDLKKKRYVEYGQGVRISDVTADFEQGTIEQTNQPLDLAIEGQGFLQFRLPDGRIAYARAGNLHQDRDGNVVNASGHPLEPALQIPQGVTDISINEVGQVFVKVPNETDPREVGRISLATFRNQQGLLGMGQNLYVQTVSSGDPSIDTPGQGAAGQLRQRSLEFSNVNVVEEMMQMILVQRSFELIIKAINAGETMLKAAADLAGK